MEKVIVYKNSDNSISIVTTSEDARSASGYSKSKSEDAFLTHLVKTTNIVPPGREWAIVPRSSFPKDGTLRDAWNIDIKKKKIGANADRAKDIILKNTRAERDKRLKELDGLELRAMSQDNTEELQKVRKVKEELRNLPKVVDKELHYSTDLDALSSYRVTFPE